MELRKYPRTHHIEGSGLQKGDHDLETVPFSDLRGKALVVEEKIDGANVGISFGPTGDLRLQCRGHYLTGGPSEEQFTLFKTWAQSHRPWLEETLGGDRYTLYGEWCFAKHTVFYDALPHYLLEFDVLDRESGVFLSTERRRELFKGKPLVSVPVLQTGAFRSVKEMTRLVAPSLYKTPNWRNALQEAATAAGADGEFVARRETDPSDLAEGLYLKWEEDGAVLGRYKWVRGDFLNAILDSGSHWRDRPLVRNGLHPDSDLFTQEMGYAEAR